MVAMGGRGGLGNVHFATPTYRAPRIAQKGEPGQERWLKLELRLIADVGIIGYPNAGKSTFLGAVTRANPKVADYPFTTLAPNLGVVRVDEQRSFVVADIPGLIEGAAEGAGLGHRFLRHLARNRLLLHLVDIAPYDEEADPVKDALAIVEELKKYDAALFEKPRWLVINKVDRLDDADRKERIAQFIQSFGWTGPVFPISALTGEGCRPLTYAIMDYLESMKKEAPVQGDEEA